MAERRSSFEFEDLLACGHGQLFGAATHAAAAADADVRSHLVGLRERRRAEGRIVAELAVAGERLGGSSSATSRAIRCAGLPRPRRALAAHGIFLGWLGAPGRGRALGVGEVKFTGMVLRSVEGRVHRRHEARHPARLKLAIADGMLKADGQVIYTASDLRVGLSRPARPRPAAPPDAALDAQSRPASAGNNETAAVTRPSEGTVVRRVVVTGMGIVSSIGNYPGGAGLLARGQVRHRPGGEIRRARLPLQVQRAKIDWQAQVPRKPKRFMEAGVGWNYIAMEQAIRDAGLETKDVVDERTGIIMGEGGPSTRAIVWAADTTL